MSSEPPSDIAHEDEEDFPRESDTGWNRSRGKWGAIAAVLGVLIVAGGVAALLILQDSGPEPTAQQGKPAEGLACPYLVRAAEAYEEGAQAEFDREIDRAAEVAEGTLQKSGQTFGEPERIALELELGAAHRTQDLLARATSACS